MPRTKGRRKSSGISRKPKGGNKKNSTTSHLHHLSSSYEGNNNDTNNEVVAGGSNNKSTKKKQQKKRNADLQLSNDRLKNKVKKLKQQHEEKEEVFNDWKAKSRKAIKAAHDRRKAALLTAHNITKDATAKVKAAEERTEAAIKEVATVKANAKRKLDEAHISYREKLKEKGVEYSNAIDKLKQSSKQQLKKQKTTHDEARLLLQNKIYTLKMKVAAEKEAREAEIKLAEQSIINEKDKAKQAVIVERRKLADKDKKIKQQLSKNKQMEQSTIEQSRLKAKEASKSTTMWKNKAAKAKQDAIDIAHERDTALQYVSQLEEDLAAKEEELEKALLNSSKPSFVFEKKARDGKGKGQKTWPFTIAKLIIELIVAGVPPNSINATIAAVVANLAPDHVKINEMPSPSYILRCRTKLLIVCQLLAAYRASKADKIGAIHTDGTGRRKDNIVNLAVSIPQDDTLEQLYILLSSSIMPEDETAQGQLDAILAFFEEKREWLGKWKEVFERDFEAFDHDINPEGFALEKAGEGGNVMTDGCSTATLLNKALVSKIIELYNTKKGNSPGSILADTIEEVAETARNDLPSASDEEEGSSVDANDNNDNNNENEGSGSDDDSNVSTNNDIDKLFNDDDDDDLPPELIDPPTPNNTSTALVIETYCHHHIRNVWWGTVIKAVSKHLRGHLATSLENIEPRLRVDTNMSSILVALHKNFSLPANYAFGSGKDFKQYVDEYHPDVPIYPVQRMNGSRNDMVLEGAVAAYVNGWLWRLHLDEQLSTPDASNGLQECLFIILRSTEMIAQFRFYSILHFSINLPLRWLAAHTHKLADEDWSIKKYGTAIDRVYEALLQILDDPTVFLDENFMMNIFKPLKLQALDDYMTHIFEVKKTQTLNGKAKGMLHKTIREELFNPKRQENIESTDMTLEIVDVGIVSWVEDMIDQRPGKQTHKHLSHLGGYLSWKKATKAEHEATKGKEATNDVCESPFGTISDQLSKFLMISLGHASATGLARTNKDFYRNVVELCTRDCHTKPRGDNGWFHELDMQMQQSLIQTAVELSAEVRKSEQDALTRQREKRREKEATLRDNKLKNVQKSYINKLFYRDMYDSARRWKNKNQVDTELGKIGSETAKKDALKEQIRIYVKGLGWEEAHHAWSCGGVEYTSEELSNWLKDSILKGLCKNMKVPKKPKFDVPTRKVLPQLGTQSADVNKIDADRQAKQEELIKKAEELRKEMEANGMKDTYSMIQQVSPPDIDNKLEGKRIEVYYMYEEPDQSKVAVWARGTVIGINEQLKDSVIVRWDKRYLTEGEAEECCVVLKAKLWNKHRQNGWRFSIDLDGEEDCV